MDKPIVAGLIVAGGKGKRMGSATPKQFIMLKDTPVLIRALLPFEHNPEINTLVVVLPRKYHARCRSLLKRYRIRKVAALAPAGRTRQLSVRHGLSALKKLKVDLVVVHDAARPLVTQELINRVCHQAERSGAASAALTMSDTVISRQSGKIIDRDDVLRIQTPQAFHFSLLYSAHESTRKSGRTEYPDEASLLRDCGTKTIMVEGDVTNIKITAKGDLLLADAILSTR
jgi:2-C-methyl-D-erythritol 4-phosphate cytidylyltransferase